MLIKTLILELLVTLTIENAAAEFRVKGVEVMGTDPDFIDDSQTNFTVHPVLNTISVEIFLLKEFPKNVTFVMQLMGHRIRGPNIDLGEYMAMMCDGRDPSKYYLPRFVKMLTENGNCGGEGKFVFPNAGLYKFPVLPKLRNRRAYQITSSNLIIDGYRTYLQYDVRLELGYLHVQR